MGARAQLALQEFKNGNLIPGDDIIRIIAGMAHNTFNLLGNCVLTM